MRQKGDRLPYDLFVPNSYGRCLGQFGTQTEDFSDGLLSRESHLRSGVRELSMFPVNYSRLELLLSWRGVIFIYR